MTLPELAGAAGLVVGCVNVLVTLALRAEVNGYVRATQDAHGRQLERHTTQIEDHSRRIADHGETLAALDERTARSP